MTFAKTPSLFPHIHAVRVRITGTVPVGYYRRLRAFAPPSRVHSPFFWLPRSHPPRFAAQPTQTVTSLDHRFMLVLIVAGRANLSRGFFKIPGWHTPRLRDHQEPSRSVSSTGSASISRASLHRQAVGQCIRGRIPGRNTRRRGPSRRRPWSRKGRGSRQVEPGRGSTGASPGGSGSRRRRDKAGTGR